MSDRRITERELILPSLYLAVSNGGFISTSELIKKLTGMMKPSGLDAQILAGRKDTYFSQKVRNLKSHDTLTAPGYAVYRDNGYSITEKGREFVAACKDSLDYLLSSDFDYSDVRDSLGVVSGRKAIPYEEIVSEGESVTVTSAVHVRSRKLRDAAIEHFTRDGVLRCDCCGFDFRSFYGKYGATCIEIHHVRPIFMYEDCGEERSVKDALENLIPVCPNCHRAIHRNHITREQLPDFKAAIAGAKNDINKD